jgi:hypothetical protein
MKTRADLVYARPDSALIFRAGSWCHENKFSTRTAIDGVFLAGCPNRVVAAAGTTPWRSGLALQTERPVRPEHIMQNDRIEPTPEMLAFYDRRVMEMGK